MTRIDGSVRPVAVTAASSPSSPSSSRAADAALRSVSALEQKRQGLFEQTKKGVVAALVGLTLLSGITPAHAEPTLTPAPQTSSWFEAAPPTGPPAVRTLLGLDSAVVAPAQARPEVQAATKKALDAFAARLAVVLHQDAGSLAQGLTPIRPGDPLGAEQTRAVEGALKNLIEELPVGAFSPALQERLEDVLGSMGRRVDLAQVTVKEAERLAARAAGDFAKDILADLKQDRPAAFWTMASTAATAAVVVGYAHGTDALARLGVKPEVSTRIFDDVKLQVGLRAGPQFSDPRATVGFSGAHAFSGGTTVQGGIRAEIAGRTLDSATLQGNVVTPGGFRADGTVRLDGSGRPFDARLSASQTVAHDWGGGGTAVLWAEGRWSNGLHGTPDGTTASLGITGTHGRWSSSLSAAHSSANHATTATLSTGRTFDLREKNDLDLQVRGSIDNRGNSFIGVGAVFRF
jgi:hypothetical protein